MYRSIAWVEVTIAGLTGGLIAGAVGVAYRFGASPDNVLNFLGGAVGSGLAVIGALWIEAHRRQKAFKQLTNSLAIPGTVAVRFAHEVDELMPALVLTLRQSVEAFEATRIATPVDNPIHQYGLQTCVFWLKMALKKMEEIEDAERQGKISNSEAIAKYRLEAQNVVGSIDDFLSLPDVPKESAKTLEYHKSKNSGSGTAP